MQPIIYSNELQTLYNSLEPFHVIDVREPYEFAEGHLANAQNIPLMKMMYNPELTSELKKDDTIVVYCLSGARSLTAVTALQKAGYTNARSLDGGVLAWDGELEK